MTTELKLTRYTETTESQMTAFMEQDPEGEYARYDQAVAVIAELKGKVGTLEEFAEIAKAMHRTDNEEIAALAAELAQINEQKPVGYVTKAALDDWRCKKVPHAYVFLATSGDLRVPLYAAPVASEKEMIERLRKALSNLADRFEGKMGDWENADWHEEYVEARALSGKEPS